MDTLFSSFHLIAEANSLLDEISESRTVSVENLNTLSNFRSQMLAQGFSAPFSVLLAITQKEMDYSAEADKDDQKKQLSYIKYISNLKKFTLNRVRVAHAAHIIALRLGESYLLPYLPLGGNHISMLVKGGEYAIKSYKLLMELLSEHYSPYMQTIATIEYTQGGQKKIETLKLNSQAHLSERIRRIYGPDAKLIKTELMRAKSSIIKNRSSKVAISCAISLAVVEEIKGKEGYAGDKLKIYNAILRRYGISPNVRIDLVEGFRRTKEELSAFGFGTFISDTFVLNPDIIKELNSIKLYSDQAVDKRSKEKLCECLFRVYATTNASERKSRSPIPSLSSVPDESQLAILDISGGIGSIKKPSLAILEKIASEEKSAGISSREFGMGFICSKYGLETEESMKLFSASREEIENSVQKVSSLFEGRGAAFLSEIKRSD
ncbi:MAG: DUF530 family protein [Candidatus Anstonellales archaeon]